MCGQFTLFNPGEVAELREAARLLAQMDTRDTVRGGTVRPTDAVPVLVPGENGKLAPVPMRWGFPRWKAGAGSDEKQYGVVINTRIETAATSPMWREAYRHRRAILPTTGFVEWQRQKGRAAARYLFRQPGVPVLYLAVVYSAFPQEGGGAETRFSIVTTEANGAVCDLHDRMPLAITPAEFDTWLRGDARLLADRQALKLARSLLSDGTPQQLSLF